MGWKSVFALCGALVVGACMSFGTEVSDNQLQQLVRGKTTEAELEARLGPPTSRERKANGETVLLYNFSKTSFTAATFVPFIGPLLAGTNSRSKIVSFSFSSDGVLKDWSAIDNDLSVRNGILNH